MTVETVKSIITRFIASKKPEALALKGSWGTGKTYIWNKITNENKDRFGMQSYCYVSLFGITSIADLRMAIFTKAHLGKFIGQKLNTKLLEDASDSLPKISSSLFGKWSVAFDSIAPHLIKDTLICLDDFERMNTESIKPDELLGYISSLKEERNCKIALIFNEDELNTHKEVYKKYREKIIDIELEFARTVAEAIEIAFPKDLPHRDLAIKHATFLNITNIRILFKITDLIGMIYSGIKDFHETAAKDAIGSTILFAWAYYSSDGKNPDIDFILKWSLHLGLSQKEKNPQKDEWDRLLTDYGLTHINAFDVAISKVIKCGYIEETGLREEAEKLDEKFKTGDLRNSYHDVWTNKFHGTFADNETEFLEEMLEKFKKAIPQLPPGNLDDVVEFLRALGKDSEADALIEEYIQKRKGDNIFDIDRLGLPYEIKDSRLRERFKQQHESTYTKPSLEEVVRKIAETNSWSKIDAEVLAEATENDFYNLFMSDHGDNLKSMIYACIEFGKREGNQNVKQNVEAALQRIGKKSKFNALRVRKFGIDI